MAGRGPGKGTWDSVISASSSSTPARHQHHVTTPKPPPPARVPQKVQVVHAAGCARLDIPKLAWRDGDACAPRRNVNGVTNPRPPLRGGRLAGLSSHDVPSKLERARACGDPVTPAFDTTEDCTSSLARLEPIFAPPGATLAPEGSLEGGSGVGRTELLRAEGMAEVSSELREELTDEEDSGGLGLVQEGALLVFRAGRAEPLLSSEPLLLWLDRVGDLVSLVCVPPPLLARGTRAGSEEDARDGGSFGRLPPAGFCEAEKKEDMLFCFSSVSFSLSFLGPFGFACESESLDPAIPDHSRYSPTSMAKKQTTRSAESPDQGQAIAQVGCASNLSPLGPWRTCPRPRGAREGRQARRSFHPAQNRQKCRCSPRPSIRKRTHSGHEAR